MALFRKKNQAQQKTQAQPLKKEQAPEPVKEPDQSIVSSLSRILTAEGWRRRMTIPAPAPKKAAKK